MLNIKKKIFVALLLGMSSSIFADQTLAPIVSYLLSDSKRFVVNSSNGTALDTQTTLLWQNIRIGHKERADAITRCNGLTLAGHSDWRLPSMAESKIFHFEMNKQGILPTQAFERCTAEVVTDGYVKTKKGAERYGGEAGDSINFSGGANVRCVR